MKQRLCYCQFKLLVLYESAILSEYFSVRPLVISILVFQQFSTHPSTLNYHYQQPRKYLDISATRHPPPPHSRAMVTTHLRCHEPPITPPLSTKGGPHLDIPLQQRDLTRPPPTSTTTTSTPLTGIVCM